MRQVLFILIFVSTSIINYAQRSFRVKPVITKNDTVEFIMPPHSKATPEGIFNSKRTLKFKTESRFRYQYISFSGLQTDALNGNYRFSAKSISKAIHFRQKDQASPILLQENYKLGYGNPVQIDKFCDYFTNGTSNLMLEIDLDTLLQDSTDWVENYNTLNTDLFITLNALSQNKKWPRGITQNLVEKIYDFLPVPQPCSLNRYLAILDKDKSFVLLNAKIWLLVDSVQQRFAGVDDSGRIKNVFPRIAVRSIPRPNDSLWFYRHYGQNLINIWRDKNGNVQQSEVYNFSLITASLPNNFFSNDGSLVLCSSSGDIQLSQILEAKTYYAFFQKTFKPNNELDDNLAGTPAGSPPTFENSQLLFFDDINQTLLNRLAQDEPESKSDNIEGAVFGLRNLIQLMMPVYLNKNNLPSAFLFNSTIYDYQQTGIIPSLKKITLRRQFNSSWRKIKFSNDNTVLIPEDKIEFTF